jgi:hypothetical protein
MAASKGHQQLPVFQPHDVSVRPFSSMADRNAFLHKAVLLIPTSTPELIKVTAHRGMLRLNRCLPLFSTYSGHQTSVNYSVRNTEGGF